MLAASAPARTIFWSVIIIATVLFGLQLLLDLEMDFARMLREARTSEMLLWSTAAVYALCLAVPFMPGLELGLLLMVVFGKAGILAAYLATVLGLNLAFLVGCLAAGQLSGNRVWDAWRERAERFERDGMGALARSRMLSWLGPMLVRRGRLAPYLLLGLLFNLPGNLILGGGGGIALVSGLSGRIHWLGFLLTVALCTAIVPLLALLGVIELERLLALTP